MGEFFTPGEMKKLCKPWYKPFSAPAEYGQLPGECVQLSNSYGRHIMGSVLRKQVDKTTLDEMLKKSEIVIDRMSRFAPLFKSEFADKVKRIGNLRNGVITPAFESSGFVIPRDGERTPPTPTVKKKMVKYWKELYEKGRKKVSEKDMQFIVDANLCYPIVINLKQLNQAVFAIFAMQTEAIYRGTYGITDLIRAEETKCGPRFAAQFGRAAIKGKGTQVRLKDGSYVEQFGVVPVDRVVLGVEKKFHFILRRFSKAFVKGALMSNHHSVDDKQTAKWITDALKAKYEVFSWDSKGFDLHHGGARLSAYIDIFCDVTGADKTTCKLSSFSPAVIKSTFGTWLYQSEEWSQLLSGDPLTTIMNLIGVSTMVMSFCDKFGYSLGFSAPADFVFKSWGDDMVIGVRDAKIKAEWISWCTNNAMPGEEEPRIAFLGKWYDSKTRTMCYYDESLIKGIDPDTTETLKDVWSRRLGLIARLQLVSDPEKLFSFMEKNWNELAWGPRFTMRDLQSVGIEAALKCSGKDLSNMVRAYYSGLGIEEVLAAGIDDPLTRALTASGRINDDGFTEEMMSVTIGDMDAASKKLFEVGQHFGVVSKRVLTEPSTDWLDLLRDTLKLQGGNGSPCF